MGIYDSMFSPGYVLNEQVARQVFDVVPERGPIIVIMDKRGNYWPSNTEEFSKLNINESFLKELIAKVDDGVEPAITQISDTSIAAAQLITDQTDCGYVIIALQQCNKEFALTHIDLVEALLNQITLIAKLIEKNNLICESNSKQYAVFAREVVSTN
jgi:hypothetical protein